MKNLTILLLGVIMFSTACKKEYDDNGNAKLSGKWKAIGSHLSSGGPMYYVPLAEKDQKIVQFNSNGKLSGFDPYEHYSIKDSVTLEFTSNTEPLQNYRYKIKKDTLWLSPSGPIVCIEGCSMVFLKD